MNKIKPSFSLKDQLFNKWKVEYLWELIENVYKEFDYSNFVIDVLVKFPELELKERITHISNMLKKYLPNDFENSVNIMIDSLPEIIENWTLDNNFWDFIFVPYCDYIQKFWCNKENLEFSLNAQIQITAHASAEDSIRYFFNKFETITFNRMLEWSKSDNYYIRRLSSEGSRAKLPWCQKINLDYRKTINILDNLYYDESRFVTRSVSNHLNDIGKIDSDLVIDVLEKWKKSKKWKDLDYIISHWTRSLVKLWDKRTLEFLGYSSNPKIEIKNFEIINKDIKIWENLEFSFDLKPTPNPYLLRRGMKLMIDYKIYFVWKNWKLLPKVFKIKKIGNGFLDKSEVQKKGNACLQSLRVIKKHPLKLMTTKALYVWEHFVEIIINWKSFGKEKFGLKK